MERNNRRLPQYDHCTACQLCVDICNHNAIKFKINKDGFNEIAIDEERCIDCGLCSKYCPAQRDNDTKDLPQPVPYWSWSKNDNLRLTSSSGGVFAQLAFDFIKRTKGCVVGATLVDGLSVKHIIIDKVEDIYLLQGSKYLQSDTHDVYTQTISKLRLGIPVLFSGTPCQVAAIKSITQGKRYFDLLSTVEVVCHGIPSFIFHQMGLKLNDAVRVDEFRTKKNVGWGSYNLTYVHKTDGKDSKRKRKEFHDFFYHSFFCDFYLRPACYNCRYAQLPRVADLSIADGWGVEHTDIKKDEISKGVSVVLVNTKRGKSLLGDSNMFTKYADWKDFIYRNPCMIMNLGYLKRLSLSRYIHVIKHFPLRLSAYVFSCYAPKNLYGIIAKLLYVPMLRLKDKCSKVKSNNIEQFLNKIDNQKL